MKKKIKKILRDRKMNLKKRLSRKHKRYPKKPVFSATNIHYDMSGRIKAIACGGIGVIHDLQQKLGLTRRLNEDLNLLKQHRPYFESDHIMNLVYLVFSGGQCLEDLEVRRQDVAYMNAIGATRIPDPTTAGDFLRRFEREQDVVNLMESINSVRVKVWEKAAEKQKDFFHRAEVDIDGTYNPTDAECKEGIGLNYKGQWGYHPLVITLSNTGEHLYMVNRPGNCPSHCDAATWIDRTIEFLKGRFEQIVIRGDTDFSLTRHFDRWDEHCTFYFGMDATDNLVQIAQKLDKEQWEVLERDPKYTVKTQERRRAKNVKEQIIREKGYKNIRLVSEHISEFPYQPARSEKDYRIVVVKKNLSVEQGDNTLFPELRYFFYITNDWKKTKHAIVKEETNKRCNHENKIEQLRNGVHALRTPSEDLSSNWAWNIITALAWNIKAWYGLLMPFRALGEKILSMEFKAFLNQFIYIPAQIVRSGRRIIYRLLGYNNTLPEFFDLVIRLGRLRV